MLTLHLKYITQRVKSMAYIICSLVASKNGTSSHFITTYNYFLKHIQISIVDSIVTNYYWTVDSITNCYS